MNIDDALLELKHNAWREGKLAYKLNGIQKRIRRQILATDGMYAFLECGRGFGKSVLLVLMAMEDAIRDKRYPAVIVGPEVKQQIRIVHQILGLLTGDAPSGFVRKLRSNNEIAVGDNHIVIAGFNRDSIERLRGLRFTRAYLDEARNCKSLDFLYGIQDILIPTLGHANGTFRIGSSTPDELDHPLITYVAPKAELNQTHFVYTIDDNETLTEPQKARLIDELGGRESEACQRELYCVRIRPRSRVALPDYRFFWDEPSDDARQYGNWIIFGDCGGTTDKTWLGLGFYDHPTARLYVLEERFFDANTVSAEHAQAVGEFMTKIPEGITPRIRIDMPGLLLVDFQKTHRIDVRNPVKPEFHQSLNQLNLAFRSNRIAIHPDCRNLKLCCEYGLLNPKRTDFERSDSFGHCDPLAGLKYGWLSCDKETNTWPVVRLNTNQIRRPQAQSKGIGALAGVLGGRR